jgi:hypothetical protein
MSSGWAGSDPAPLAAFAVRGRNRAAESAPD